MAPRQRQPTGERRKQIAAAALRIIEERGATGLTAAELGRAVGIADATLFRHFKNKNEIVQAAIEHLHELMFEGFPPTESEPLARLRSFFVSHLKMVETRPNLLRLAITDRLIELAGQEGLAKLLAMAERSHAFVVECLREARDRGEIGAQHSPELLVYVVLGAMKASAFSQMCPAGSSKEFSPEKVWETVESLLRTSAQPRLEKPKRKRAAG